MTRRRTSAPLVVALLVAVLATGIVLAPGPAVAAPAGCTAPTGVYQQGVPWAQQLLDPARVWPVADGSRQLVAVVGTGVDAGNRQLADRVLPGKDLTGRGDARDDCDGRGTVAAGMIAASAEDSTTFAGLAPAAKILPVRYVQSHRNSTAEPDPDLLAAGIRAAIKASATVICVAVPANRDSGALHAALRQAEQADVVVVSPAIIGDDRQTAGRSYPTADPAVLGVAAVDRSGRAVSTESGDYVDVSAPGAGLVAAAAGTGSGGGQLWPVRDPSAAAGYAAGVVALVRSYRPELSAGEIVSRLEQTATRPASDGHDPRLGWGTVDPYAAVTAELPGGHRSAGRSAPTAIAAAQRPAAHVDPRRFWVLLLGFGALVLTVALVLGVTVVRAGRARGWRPARRVLPADPVRSP